MIKLPKKATNSFLLLLGIVIFSSFSWHKFYVSLTEMRVNEENKTIEISIRIFPDDLDKAISEIYGINPQIITEIEHKNADAWINEYIQQRFSFQVNDKDVAYTYIGKEEESDAVWCYFEAKYRGTPKNIRITQQILTESFSDQVNIVQFYYKDFNKGLMLYKGQTTKVIEISNVR